MSYVVTRKFPSIVVNGEYVRDVVFLQLTRVFTVSEVAHEQPRQYLRKMEMERYEHVHGVWKLGRCF